MHMNQHALQHIPKSHYAYALNSQELCIRFRTAKDDVREVTILYADKFATNQWSEKPMVHVLSDRLFDYYETTIAVKENRYIYYFKLTTEAGSIYFGENGIQEGIDEEAMVYNVFQFPFLHEVDVHKIPTWTQEAVFYQIFIDRFFKSEQSPCKQPLQAWGTLPHPKSYYGGDLKGITEKLDYLQDLGITALYLTPIFEANTNHKYDTQDYLKIDPDFGTEEDLKALVSKAHEKNIRVVLDAVFNHSGYFFGPFQDVIEKGRASKYFDWFHIQGDTVEQKPKNYLTFAFEHKMPKLNTANKEVQAYLLKVATYWIERCDIDGWRLDVSDEVDHVFWRQFREAVKEVKPEAIILGENWHNAEPWLKGDQYDGVMNYGVTKACLDYFAHDTLQADTFAYTLSELLIRNTHQANASMLNLLDSHDTARMLNLCDGDRRKVRLAVTFLMTYVGMPCTYYGTEIAMAGNGDPDCRRTFEWDTQQWDQAFHSYFKQCTYLRNTYKALQQGTVRFKSTKDLFVMERTGAEESIFVYINNTSEQKTYALPQGVTKELLSGMPVTAEMNETATIAPYEAKLYYKKR